MYEGAGGVFAKDPLLFGAVRTPKVTKLEEPFSNTFDSDNKYKFNKLLSKTSNITIT